MRNLKPMSRKVALGLMVLGTCVLTACETTGSKEGMTMPADFPAASTTVENSALLRREYTESFRIGDEVTTEVFQVPELSGQFRVGSSGMVDFPIIGEVNVLGMTTEELQRELKRKYGEDYLNNPTIVVTRDAALRGRIVVDGKVKKPGIFEVFNDMSLLVAIAQAGGIDEDANTNRVLIMREVDGQRLTGLYSLKAIRNQGLEDPVIIPGDMIFVDTDRVGQTWKEIIRTSPLIALFVNQI